MAVIKKLGDRVEKEHNQYLRDSQRHEDRSAMTVNGTATSSFNQPVDFASLVAGANASGASLSANHTGAITPSANGGGDIDWGDDVWGSILASPGEVSIYLLALYQFTYFDVVRTL